ncbi:MAG: UvrD-helicase domain-containing protein [Clostridiaceae bacterium]|nr:UvrD-helicase domain-containing protein [Clostridiaceae bacterium]
MSVNWTEEQLQAIEYDQPRPLLVSAAAGSGKTAVLIERIFRRVMTKKVEPENILVATFTDKAATQMRRKIDEKIAAEMQQATDPTTLKHLRELKQRFPLAQISTIHAFCLNLIKEYGAYLTDQNGQLILQPGFTTISQTYRDIYLNQAIDEVLTDLYQKISELNISDDTSSNFESSQNNLAINAVNSESRLNELNEKNSNNEENNESEPTILNKKDFNKDLNREDVSTSLVLQEIPGIQSKIELFNLLEEPITQDEWLQDFDRLVLMITDSLSDQPVRDQLARSLAQLRSMAYFETEIQQALKDFQAQAEDFSRHPLVKEALEQIEALINPAIEGLDYALNSEHLRIVLSKKTRTKEHFQIEERLNLELKVIQKIKQILTAKSSDPEKWNQIHEQGKLLGDFISLRANNSCTPEALAKMDFIENYEPNVLPIIAMIHPDFRHNSAIAKRNQLENTKPYFIRSTHEIEQDLQSMLRPLARFFETVILVERRFQQIKIRHNQIDFNDYEHYALQLLDQPEIAKVLHEKYQEIYLDEYQDTNPIQETLISRIKCPRVFMVGDLKQSIYRFRFADPGLFRKKLSTFFLYDKYEDSLCTAENLSEAENDLSEADENLFATDQDLPETHKKLSKAHQDLSEAAENLFATEQDLSETHKKLSKVDQDLPKQLPENFPDGYTVLLNRNFRSSETILHAINDLFSWFMRSEIAEIEYDHTQMLIPGRADLSEIELSETELGETELGEAELSERLISLEHLVIPNEINDFDLNLIPELTRIKIESGTDLELALEALQAVKIIKRELLNGRQLSDIAILSRKHDISSIYKQVLAAYGIPVSGGEQATYLETQELRFLTQLISLLDNFQQDIPLASVMRSQIFGIPFDENELLALRLSQPDAKYFYEVVQNASKLSREDFVSQTEQILTFNQNADQNADQNFDQNAESDYADESDKSFDKAESKRQNQITIDLYNKLHDFMRLINDLRNQSKWLSLAELLDNIFRIADYPDYLMRLPFSEQRLSDIERFQQWANQFEQEQGGGLRNFIVYINQITEQKLKLENFDIPPAPGNSVATMTIHASKGLEFPVVILAGANNQLSVRRSTDILNFDPTFGLSSYIVNFEQQATYSSPANAWHQEQIISMELAEEYRLLYVAMTRAEEKLYILSSEKMKSTEDEYYGKALELINQNFTRSNFQNLKSYAEIIVGYLNSQDKRILEEFPGYSILATYDFLDMFRESPETENSNRPKENNEQVINNQTTNSEQVMNEKQNPDQKLNLPDLNQKRYQPLTIGKYSFSVNYLSEIFAELKQVNCEYADYLVQAEATGQIRQSEIILPADSGSEAAKAIERLKKLLPDLPEEDPLNLIPAKLTVSEISAKEQIQNLDSAEQIILPSGMADMGYTLRKPEPEPATDEVSYSGREFGTFIHSLMQFIKPEDFLEQPEAQWENIFREQIEQMIHKQQLFAKNKSQAKAAYPFLEKFLRSEIAQRLYQVEKAGGPVYREIPFTLAIPATQVLDVNQIKQLNIDQIEQHNMNNQIERLNIDQIEQHNVNNQIEQLSIDQIEHNDITKSDASRDYGQDQTLIQGMIDLWFIENDQAILLDYKSDYILGNDRQIQAELEKRYAVQLKYYTLAIEKIIERPVKERYIWLFRQGKAYSL